MKTIKKDRLKLLVCGGIQKAAAKLHMGPTTLATMVLEIRDENGNLEKRIEQKSNSFVRNYYNMLAYAAILKSCYNSLDTAVGTFGDGVDTPVKNTSGTLWGGSSTTTSSLTYPFNGSINSMIAAGAGTISYGIVVGTSNSAESFDSYVMGAQVAHGTGAGKLSYAAQQSLAGFTFDSGTKKLAATHSRAFSNSSGATIAVKEIGFITSNGGQPQRNLIIRDVLATPIDVLNGKTLTVIYDLSLVMSN